MKDQICIRTSRFVSQLESAFRQLSAVLTPYLIADNLSGIQINNSTNIVILFIVPEECDIADPYFIWSRCMKLLIQLIPVQSLLFVVVLLGTFTNADESHVLHELSHHSLTHTYTA